MQSEYNLDQHIHNYAVWTAARAVQRNFTTTANIKRAIEQSGLRSFALSNDVKTSDEFDNLHKEWSNQLISAFDLVGVPSCSYGRAAKIISIYLKTSVLLCNRASCNASKVIHPPIDGILLKSLSQLSGLEDLKAIRWTKLDKTKYWELIKRLRCHFRKIDWRLEMYWSPELD
jgi:hypothetical protein